MYIAHHVGGTASAKYCCHAVRRFSSRYYGVLGHRKPRVPAMYALPSTPLEFHCESISRTYIACHSGCWARYDRGPEVRGAPESFGDTFFTVRHASDRQTSYNVNQSHERKLNIYTAVLDTTPQETLILSLFHRIFT